jgi:hypothetical protein
MLQVYWKALTSDAAYSGVFNTTLFFYYTPRSGEWTFVHSINEASGAPTCPPSSAQTLKPTFAPVAVLSHAPSARPTSVGETVEPTLSPSLSSPS